MQTDSKAGWSAVGNRFAATRWSLFAAANTSPGGDAARALEELCGRYRYPVYAYLRGLGQEPGTSELLTVAFFETLKANGCAGEPKQQQGRFRDFLLRRLNDFLQASDANARPEWRSQAQDPALEARYQAEVVAGENAEQCFQRGYALQVLRGALERLRIEAERAGRLPMFDRLQPLLTSEPAAGALAAIAAELGMQPVAALLALKRLRQRFRELAEAELSETVSNAGDLQHEREALARVLLK
ncbi:MAG: hypothetical protein KDI48_10815 [Xanthomonadales bacterium]|nr:hypothetical protein [Xanthomonadales bacterium]